jgi:flavin reductase (DIM6/NTAB) family NADH-FMN oxidoreductase RutF
MEVRFADLEQAARYKLLIGLVYPRPIALISTTNANGVHNAAPFSFFNVVADEPAMVMVSFNRRRDGTLKHTVRNIRRSRCFVVNLVDEAIANRMLVAGQDLPDAVSEFEAAGLTPAPSYPPRAKHGAWPASRLADWLPAWISIGCFFL